ncbi:MAG: von Willebrand factor type A domain-containing protein [Synergistaceae bacterium]|jgi:hypothetical protein|nr:von Willebrand factor type A domain-containing protein [Synergistaceae bacterium]
MKRFIAMALLILLTVMASSALAQFGASKPTTRYEMASLLARGFARLDISKASEEDIELLRKLAAEFRAEFVALGVNIDRVLPPSASEDVRSESVSADAANPFGIIPDDHWAHDAVSQLTARGIFRGYPDATFSGPPGTASNLPGYNANQEWKLYGSDVTSFRSSGIYSLPDTARYGAYDDNPVKIVARDPLATFSLDVNTTSYTNVRRFLNGGVLPNPDAVRVEELINYL